ncbi:SH3 domain-containing protein [Eisenbergiella sp.]
MKLSEEQKKMPDGSKPEGALNEFIELLKKNKKSLAVIIVTAVVLLGIGILLGSLIGKKSGGKDATQEQSQAAATQTQSTEAIPNVPMEVNAYPEINSLMKKYYNAAAEGDMETVKSLKDYSDQAELLRIQEKSKYLESYDDINCYTKPGPIEDSYVVYVTYYAKFHDIDQKVTGLNTYIVCRKADDSYYIHDCSEDESMKEYRTNVTKQDDVVDLFNKVQVEYNEAVTENEELAAFLTDLSEKLKTAVGDALAEAETTVETESAEEEAQEPADNAGEAASSKVRATDVVNIRKSDSETADSLGKAQVGDEFALLENRANGWSKIDYNGQEAYIKSEFLESVSEEPQDTGDGNAEAGNEADNAGNAGNTPDTDNTDNAGNNSQPDTPGAGDGAPSANVPNSGTYRLTTTVNIRKSASETAERLGVGYYGDEVEILMKQADGWTKVKFKGETGYIKTDVLK